MSGAEPEVRPLREEEYDAWNGLVRESPEGSVYAMPDYLRALAQATGGSFRIVGVFHGDELAGGVGLHVERDAVGFRAEPRLLLYYNGPILRRFETRYPGERTRKRLRALRALEAFLRSSGLDRIVLKPRGPVMDVRAFTAAGWSARPVHSYVVPVADPAALRARMDRNARRLVNRAEREGLTAGPDPDFDAFWRLHRETHERKGAPLYLPEVRFAAFFESLRARGLAELYIARLPGGRSVAAQLVLLGPHPVTHTVAAAADDDHQRTGANPFLRWRVFEELARAGYQANDLTDASLNSVTDFKAQLGGDLVTSLELSHTTARARAGRVVSRSVWRARRRMTAGLRQLGVLS